MGIEDPEIVQLVNQIEELEKKLFSHPLHKVFVTEILKVLYPYMYIYSIKD